MRTFHRGKRLRRRRRKIRIRKNERLHEDGRTLEQKLRDEDERGIAGMLHKSDIYHEAALKPNFQLLDPHRVVGRKSFLNHVGERLSQLRKILGSQPELDAFAVFCLIIKEREEFDGTLSLARRLQNVHAIDLLDDIDDIIDRELVPHEDGSPIEIFGMEFTYEHEPIEEKVISLSYELWQKAGMPDGRYQEFFDQAKAELMEPDAPFRRIF